MTRLLLAALLLCPTIASAQLGIETSPGVTHYGLGGGTTGIEISPGVTRYSGGVNGSAVEIAPGITHYNFNNMDAFTDALIERSERDFERRQQSYKQQDLERRLRESEREIKTLREQRR